MEVEQKTYIFENTSLENQVESENSINKELRYKQILEILTKPMTAKQIAVEMKKRGYTPTDERNFSAPRLTELEAKGEVEIYGTTTCEYTGKKVNLYMRKGEMVSKKDYDNLVIKYNNMVSMEHAAQAKIREKSKEIIQLRKMITELQNKKGMN